MSNPAFVVERGVFWAEVRAWTWRGLLAALPSYLWFNWIPGPRSNHLAVALGVIGFILLYAAACTPVRLRATDGGRRALRSLRAAVWVKTALSLAVVGVFLDGYVGGYALGLVSRLDSARPHAWTFLKTLAATLVQGTFVSLELLVLALVVRFFYTW